MHFNHFTLITNHVADQNRIITAILWSIMINAAAVLAVFGWAGQPWAVGQWFLGIWIDPDFSIGNMPGNVWSMGLPPCHFRVSG